MDYLGRITGSKEEEEKLDMSESVIKNDFDLLPQYCAIHDTTWYLTHFNKFCYLCSAEVMDEDEHMCIVCDSWFYDSREHVNSEQHMQNYMLFTQSGMNLSNEKNAAKRAHLANTIDVARKRYMEMDTITLDNNRFIE